MAGKEVPGMKGVRVFPPPPKGFDALAATKKDLARHGLPQRPDPRKQPAVAALWEQRMRRYQGFEHLEPELLPADQPAEPVAAGFGLDPLESCGYELFNRTGPITILSGTWTVPNLNHSPTVGFPTLDFPNHFRTFFGLGFLDLHVEMTIDAAQNITSVIRAFPGPQVALPVHPGDAISATLCLETNPAGTAFFGLANETTSQTMNFTIDTGFPPAVAINAGISRGSPVDLPFPPFDPLARFGVVYFDEITAFAINGSPLLTDGVPTTMVDSNGSVLAQPMKLNDFAFKAVFESA
jgi:Peptidase A4 family